MKLKDPSKAAGEIVSTHNGYATRNDGGELKPANSNPWYVLATIHGEQKKGPMSWLYESELAEQNRRAWNGWFCQNLKDEDISQLVKDFSLDEGDVCRLTDAELHEIKHKFLQRMGSGSKLPERHFVPNDESMPEFGGTWNAECFSQLLFDKPINFDGFLFDDEVCFDYSVFLDRAKFSKAVFIAGASFGNVHFSESVDFSNCKFVKSSQLKKDRQLKAEGSRANFAQVVFSDEVSFQCAKFAGEAAFRFAQFSRNTSFTEAVFKDYAAFRSSIFLEHAIFRGVQFGGFVNFASASFKSITRFDDASFQELVPEFYGASIFENATFPCSSGEEKNWPQLSGKTAKQVEQQKRAYNRLRLFMNRSLQIDEEQFFHRQEMRCKREIETSCGMKVLYGSFERVSDYGNSVWKPVQWLFGLWFIGWVVHLHRSPIIFGEAPVWESAAWSFANLLPIFGFQKRFFDDECLHIAIQVTGGVQTVAGFILLFFLGLGLRNRFRLR